MVLDIALGIVIAVVALAVLAVVVIAAVAFVVTYGEQILEWGTGLAVVALYVWAVQASPGWLQFVLLVIGGIGFLSVSVLIARRRDRDSATGNS